MDINLKVTFDISSSLQQLLISMLSLAVATSGTPAEPPAKRTKKNAEPQVPESPLPPAAAPMAPVFPMTAAPAPAPAAPAPTANLTGAQQITPDEISALITQTLPKIGVETMRELFKKFGAAKFADLPATRYAEFAAALQQARSLVS